jgi:hypothetical protein
MAKTSTNTFDVGLVDGFNISRVSRILREMDFVALTKNTAIANQPNEPNTSGMLLF